jgi:Cyanobacterial and plant NDH-1 subunit O
MAVKKGDIVRAIREKLDNSLESTASDTRWPSYLFDTKGEIVDAKGDYVLVKFGQVPTPNIWLRTDQLEKFEE